MFMSFSCWTWQPVGSRAAMEPLRVVELYSGIGGMHYALKECGVSAQVVAAVDINTTANVVYQHNFPDTPLWNKTIEGIPLEVFNKLSFDVLLMSPPCQPFTRIGLQGDLTDTRTKSFLYILHVLPRLCRRPRFILLENVKGFEASSARERLVETLEDCGYEFQELMLSPTSVGIPNSRLRYFLMARLATERGSCGFSTLIPDAFRQSGSSGPDAAVDSSGPARSPEHRVLYKLETAEDVQRKSTQNKDRSVRKIQDFLEPPTGADVQRYLIPPRTLLRYGLLLDVVRPSCRRSVCFTKGYGRYVEGTGSVLQDGLEAEMQSVFEDLDVCSEEEKVQRLLKLQLRYFTPREVANIMGFPPSFTFPEQTSTLQRYRVLGNSLNVVLVSRLLQLLVC